MQELPEMRQAVEKNGELGTLFDGIGTDCAVARKKAYELTECICEDTARELNRQDFSHCSSAFLQDHLEDIMREIRDPQIRCTSPDLRLWILTMRERQREEIQWERKRKSTRL